jgi:fructose-1,6-bisphosphatase-3
MIDRSRLPLLRALGRRYPNTLSVLTEIGHLSAVLVLPKDSVHVVSDIHGEHKKLRHILNNASGVLRLLVDRLFRDRLSEDEKRDLLAIVYYPREAYAWKGLTTEEQRSAFVLRTLALEIEIARELARDHTEKRVESMLAPSMQPLFRELLAVPQKAGGDAVLAALVEPFVHYRRELDLLRAAARFIRNLTVDELIVAGDLGDRGPRLDKVVDLLVRLPRARVVWGNHDASWMGACLGHEALIATVVRISLRYSRISQLEEGYGIPLSPVEHLARTAYEGDPAIRFATTGEGARDALLTARMQKAAAILQFKLEGQLARRRPEYGLESRCLLHRIDPVTRTVTLGDSVYPMLDSHFPTIDWNDPYALSEEEKTCIAQLRESFLHSPALWRHMSWVERQGSMWERRDRALIFHGCVPVTADGAPAPFVVDGVERRGRALFDALGLKLHHAFRGRAEADLDMLYYLWTGPLSPLFGKDKMATFESYFIADKQTHVETKNPYFTLIHDKEFCKKVLTEFGVDGEHGLIVNGHVPVKLEKGESPLKRSGRAVTIDGAFSEAYGDKGYTLVLDASRTTLALHHHFESVEDAVLRGADIIPAVEDIETFERPRTVGETEKGEEIRLEIEVLAELLSAYEENVIVEQPEEAL